MAGVFACDRCGAIVPVPQGGQAIVLLSARGEQNNANLMRVGDLRKEVCNACESIIRHAIVNGPPTFPPAVDNVVALRSAS